MAITHPTVSPHRSVDASGQALPMSTEEIRRTGGCVARGQDALDNMGDEEEQTQTLTPSCRPPTRNPCPPAGNSGNETRVRCRGAAARRADSHVA